MTHLKLLQGSEIATVFRRSDVVVFRYQLNLAGVILGGTLSLVGLALAGVCWWETGLVAVHWRIGFALLLGAVLALVSVIAYWVYVAKTRAVLVAPEGLFLGGQKKIWAISWGLLDRHALGLEDLQLKKLSASLRIVVAGQTLSLHLYNMVTYLADIEGLMFHLLQALEALEASDETPCADGSGSSDEDIPD